MREIAKEREKGHNGDHGKEQAEPAVSAVCETAQGRLRCIGGRVGLAIVDKRGTLALASPLKIKTPARSASPFRLSIEE